MRSWARLPPRSLKIEPLGNRPDLSARLCGFWHVHHGRRLTQGRAVFPLQKGTATDGAGGDGGGSVLRDVVAFLSRPRRVPPSNRRARTRTNARLTRQTGGLGLGRSYSSSGQAKGTVDVYSN